MARGLRRGDIHLVRFQPPDKERPVLLLTRDSIIGALATVTVAPVTSTIRSVASEVILDVADGMKQRCIVNLHGIVTVRKNLVGRRIAGLGPERMAQVCAALNYALGCGI